MKQVVVIKGEVTKFNIPFIAVGHYKKMLLCKLLFGNAKERFSLAHHERIAVLFHLMFLTNASTSTL